MRTRLALGHRAQHHVAGAVERHSVAAAIWRQVRGDDRYRTRGISAFST